MGGVVAGLGATEMVAPVVFGIHPVLVDSDCGDAFAGRHHEGRVGVKNSILPHAHVDIEASSIDRILPTKRGSLD